MDKKSILLWDKYQDEFLDELDKTIDSFEQKVKALKDIREKALDNKCEVKGCRRRGTFIIISHEEGDHMICGICLDKYYTSGDQDNESS